MSDALLESMKQARDRKRAKLVTAVKSTGDVIERVLATIQNDVLAHTQSVIKFAGTQPQTKPCILGGTPHRIDIEASAKASWRQPKMRIIYAPCKKCVAKCEDVKMAGLMVRSGVPKNLLHARLANWKVRTTQDQKALATVKNFTLGKTPMLVLHGSIGTGKSHLAAGLMALEQRSKLMLTQKSFITRLRRRYSDNNADDIIEKCKRVKLLVLDELEIPTGGRDELPALHEVFYHRFDDADEIYGKSEHLRTVFTTNLTLEEMRDGLGDRIVDRLRVSAVFCELAGRSMRGSQLNILPACAG